MDKKGQYEITVVIFTYRPDKRKLLTTLHSVLLQESVDMQIVISDDGSEENFFRDSEKYMTSRKFHNFRFVKLKTNKGTVANFHNALPYVQGRYMKALSPGDMLYGKEALRRWIDFMENRSVKLSFSNVIYYRLKDGKVEPMKARACPQIVRGGVQNIRRNQLELGDIWLGAVELVYTDIQQKYIDMLYNKVIYAEDNMYRYMSYEGIDFAYYPVTTVLYEYGSGVSTSGDPFFTKKMKQDREESDKLFDKLTCVEIGIEKGVRKEIELRKQTEKYLKKHSKCGRFPSIGLWLLWLKKNPRYAFFRFRTLLFPRYTDMNVDQNVVLEILNI